VAAAARRRRTRLIIIAAGAAVVAGVLIWLFVLRGPATSGDEFVGTWRSVSMGSIGSAAIARGGDAFSVLLSSPRTSQTATVAAHLDGDRLVITPGDFSASSDPDAKKLELLLKLYAGDFRIELSSVDPARLLLHLSGVSPAGQSVEERTPLEKAQPSPGATP
jgi:hypothetical protein